MKIKYLFAIFALFFITPAVADIVPFFKYPGVIDTSKWYIAGPWNEQNCRWKPAEVLPVNSNLMFAIQSKADFTGTLNDIPITTPATYACGQIQSYSQQSYGLYEVRMKTATGSGVNTAAFAFDLKSRDEIDLEALGLHPTQMSINYWVGGINQSLKPIELGFDASQDFHTYGFDFQKTSITWYVDGKQVYKTLPGAPIPTHAMKIYADLWTGMPGWMGKFTYTKPVTAEISWIAFTPAAALVVGPPSPPSPVHPISGTR